MKICDACGKKIRDEARFCPYCGVESEIIPEDASGEEEKDEAILADGRNRLVFIVIAAIAFLLVSALVTPRSSALVPSEYVKVTCRGLNGEGTAEFVFDADSFLRDCADQRGLKPAQKSELENLLTQAKKYFSLSKTQELSNGEKISIICTMPDDYLSVYKIKIKTKDYQFKVTGLVDAQDISETHQKQLLNESSEHITSLFNEKADEIKAGMDIADGQIIWSGAEIIPTKILKYYSEDPAINYTRLIIVYGCRVPVMQQDEHVQTQTVYAAEHFVNVSENEDDELSYEWKQEDGFYYTTDTLEDMLASVPERSGLTDGAEQGVEVSLQDEDAAEQKEEQMEPISEVHTEEPETETDASAWIPDVSEGIASEAKGIIEYEGHRYYRFDVPMTWKQADFFCKQAGGSLVSSSSRVKQSLMKSIMDKAGCDYYWMDDSDGPGYAAINASGGVRTDLANDAENVGVLLDMSAGIDEQEEYLADSSVLLHQQEVKFDACANDTYGEKHFGVLAFLASENAWSEYLTEGQYDRMEGDLSVYEGAAGGASFDFAVFGDGELLYHQCALTRMTPVIHFSVDLTGVSQLMIVTDNKGEQSSGYLMLDKTKLHLAEENSEEAKRRLVTDEMMDGSRCEAEKGLWRDTAGEMHDSRLKFDAGSQAYAAWNLKGAVKTLKGTIAMDDETSPTASMSFRIYGDDQLLFETNGLNRMKETETFEVDLTDVMLLEIKTDCAAADTDAVIYLTDDVMK